jgi:hypothetical protein
VAEEEVAQGLVDWRILTAAELEAQRQAMVEQLRAEMGSEEGAEGARTVPDVLPTAAAAPKAEAVDDGHDDELSRLQKLLGMAGVAVAGDSDKADEETGKAEDVADLTEGEDVIGLDDLALEEEASAGDDNEEDEDS